MKKKYNELTELTENLISSPSFKDYNDLIKFSIIEEVICNG